MHSPDEIKRAFTAAINMSGPELTRWLETPQSHSVGFVRDGATESVGHASGRRIVAILRAKRFTEADYAHMRKTVGFIRRHRAQRPYGDISRTRWRYSLMNWGHDPMKDDPL